MAQQQPSTLRFALVGAPSDATDGGARFVLFGDATAAPIEAILPDPGVTLPLRPRRRSGHPFRLHLLHLNDLHGHISRLEQPGSPPILSHVAGRVQQLHSHCQDDPLSAVLLLSAGDELAGSIFDDVGANGLLHPVYHLYSRMGLDAAVLGNHDLDLGPARLADTIRRHARFPVLAANLAPTPELAELVHPAALLVVKGVRVGLVGLTTPARAEARPGLVILDPAQTLANLLPALRPLCDVLIVLSHLGLRLDATGASVAAAGDMELATSLPRGAVHAIVGGHTHHALNADGLEADNIVNGVPLLHAGSLGRYLGEATITVNGAAAVTDARLSPVHELPADPQFEIEAVQPIIAHAQRLMQRPLGRVDHHPDLRTEAVRNDFALGESALANFICDALVERGRMHGLAVDLAVIDRSVVRCGLPTDGRLAWGDWYRVMPYADTVRLMRLTGHDLVLLLNDNARRAGRSDESHTERGFLHFSRHLRYLIDPGASRRSAFAQMALVNRSPLDWHLERVYSVACPSFVRQLAAPWERRAAAELGFMPLSLARWPASDTGLFLRHELTAFIEQAGGVTGTAGAQRDGRLRVLWSTLMVRQSYTESTEATQRAQRAA
jgi:2',3'-cyclic-nucleotide 2'-phosphodiesterase (5'-nucleotidase family)